MATAIPAASNAIAYSFGQNNTKSPKPSSVPSRYLLLNQGSHHYRQIIPLRKRKSLSICFVLAKQTEEEDIEKEAMVAKTPADNGMTIQTRPNSRVAERVARKKSERYTYLVAAIMSSFGITSMAVLSVYYRFSWQMEVP